MAVDPPYESAPAVGDVFEPNLKLLRWRRLRSVLMAALDAAVTLLWWYEVPLLNGEPLSMGAGVGGIVAILLGLMAYSGARMLLHLAGRLIIGDDSLQIVSDRQVLVQIPFHNVVRTYTRDIGKVGSLGLVLANRREPSTRVPPYLTEGYEIQAFIYSRSVEELQAAVDRRLKQFRTLRPAAEPQATTSPS